MVEQSKVDKAERLALDLADALGALTDAQFQELCSRHVAEGVLKAIQDPNQQRSFARLGDYMLARKAQLSFLAALRDAIGKAYPVRIEKAGTVHMASVIPQQWFDDAVIYVEGDKPYQGLFAKYDGSNLSYGVAARKVEAGESMGPDDVEFIPLEQAKAKLDELARASRESRRRPITRLEHLLNNHEDSEAAYQELLRDDPWSLGLRWKAIQRHENLDDANIPDFTGRRSDRDVHDIIEIKPPFMPLFKGKNQLRAEFNDAWNQCERYLDFVDREADYLRRQKGLTFENARCYLVLGYRLSGDRMAELRRKERMNRRIEVRTYDDLLQWMRSTVEFIERRGQGSEPVPDV